MKVNPFTLPYHLTCCLVAYIRRRRFERWVMRWNRYRERNNVKRFHD